VFCDYCGVKWRRSQCTRDASGRLACPDDRKGKDELTLSEENAAAAAQLRRSEVHEDGGRSNSSANSLTQDAVNGDWQRTTRDHIVPGWAPPS
jgi:hypothetical protein